MPNWTDAKADPTVSTVFVFKRDRLARPQDVLQMVALERDLILSGVTLVTHDRVFTPEDVKANGIVYLITSLIEYQQHGRFSPQLGDRMIFIQAAMAVKGYSTGGRAPYGFARALVGPDDQFVQWLEDGEKIRRLGHHVRFLPYDVDKLRTWVMMLEWRAAGDGYKRIARKLNELGIAAPDAGRVRRDHGQRHHVPGKWHPTTVRDLCSNPLIAGIKQYAKRSMGRYRRVGPDGPRELTEADRGPGDQPRTLENPLELRVRADSGGEAFVDAATWDALQPKGRTQEEGRRAGGRKPNNPDRYPLSTRIIDLTDGCGSALHGRKSGERLIDRCGEQLDQDLGTARQRMAREKDDARYDALAKAFDEIRTERDQAARRVEELTKRPAAVTVAVSPEEKVDALMLAIDELAAVTTDETARERIRPVVLRLGIWIGFDYEGYTKGKGKRPFRRLRRGVIAFGQENLPIRVHGARHVAVEETVTVAPPPRRLATQPVRRAWTSSPPGPPRRPTTITACHPTRRTTIRAPGRVAGARRSNPVPKEAMAPVTAVRTSPSPGWCSFVR